MAEQDEGPFNIKGLLGQGAFGKVYLLEDAKGNKRALKQIAVSSVMELNMTLQEIKLLSELKHPHVLRYIHAFQEGVTVLFLVTEYCSNGDIDKYLKDHNGQKLGEERLLMWIKQVTEALQYVHGEGVIHRDLKTANVFLDENWDTKLGDFGIARQLKAGDLATTVCGTPLYMSPEVLLRVPYTAKTDIFSLGIMMLEMTFMETGLEELAPHLQFFKLLRCQAPTLPVGYSDGVSDLITKMTTVDPDSRPSAGDLLKHPLLATKRKADKPPVTKANPKVTPLKPEIDKDWGKVQGTLTLLDKGRQFSTEPVKQDAGAAQMPNMEEEFESNPIMSVVERTLVNMGFNHKIALKDKSYMERQAQMLKMYCLKCLDNNEQILKKASEALDKDKPEDEIEEELIQILGHERFAMCGIQLLYYKNFTFLLKK